MNTEHDPFLDNLAAYAFGSLDPDEVAALEAHLPTCETCRAELAEYRRLSADLLAALPARPPRAGLRRRLQRTLAGSLRPKRAGFNWSFGQVLTGALLAALIGVNILMITQVYALRQEQAELLDQRTSEQTALAMLAYPTTRTLAFDQNGVSGSLLIDKQRGLLGVFAWNLPVAPAGKAYQMWLIDPKGDRTSGGFLLPEDGYPFVMATILSPQPLSSYTGFGITLEPFGGSLKPTGPRILRVDF